MTRWTQLGWLVLCGTLLGCTSGGSGPSCNFGDPAVLPTAAATPGMAAAAAWSKFRYDRQNTGTIVSAQVYGQLAANSGQLAWAFTPTKPAGPFVASPVLNASQSRVYIGNTNGRLYAINAVGACAAGTNVGEVCSADTDCPGSTCAGLGTEDTAFNFALSEIAASITSTALVTIRDGNDAVFVGGGDGRIYGTTNTGTAQNSNWPFSGTGFIATAPNIGSDGTVYAGSLDGTFDGVCPNGIFRFSLSTANVRSAAAITPDGVVLYGADDNQLRALRNNGVFYWAFSATAPIVAAPVVEASGDTTIAIYVADTCMQSTRKPARSSGPSQPTGRSGLHQQSCPTAPIKIQSSSWAQTTVVSTSFVMMELMEPN